MRKFVSAFYKIMSVFHTCVLENFGLFLFTTLRMKIDAGDLYNDDNDTNYDENKGNDDIMIILKIIMLIITII